MSRWKSARARRVLAALESIGWTVQRQRGSHRVLARNGWPDFVFAFHNREEIGPKMLARISRRTGLEPDDCRRDVVLIGSNVTGWDPALRGFAAWPG